MKPNSFIILAVFLSAASCAKNPVTGQRQFTLLSEAQEIAMGREADPQVRAEFGVVDDIDAQAYLRRVGEKIAAVSHRPDLEWRFGLLDSPVINAMALPGGYVYFTRGILAYMNNEAELAAVMGHEVGHVTYRHSVSQISQVQLAQIGLGVGGILSPTFQQFGGLAETGLGLLFLKNGRDAERESDEVGIEYAAKAGFDPRAASEFFSVLQQQREEDGASIPTWLSTHPDPGERVQSTRRIGERWVQELARSEWTRAREEHLRSIDGLVFGDNPREGFMEEDWFLHPDLRFKIRFPSNWKVQNTKQSVIAMQPQGEAAIQLTLASAPSGTTPETYAEKLAQEGLRPVTGRRTEVNGNPAFIGYYRLQDSQGPERQALALFLSYGGNLYQIVGMTGDRYRQYEATFERTLLSFDVLRDPAALSVQPDRIRVIRAAAGDTLASLIRRNAGSRASEETISALNRIPLDQSLDPGTMVKIVQPGR